MLDPARQLIITGDGSHTVSVPGMHVTYHSLHGAIQESEHVFINAGLKYVLATGKLQALSIFEMGFGTGLNALLTLMEAERLQLPVHYTTIELFPLPGNEINLLNYCEQLQRPDLLPLFQRLHQSEWGTDIAVTPYFTLHKIRNSLLHFSSTGFINLVYYDAFAPSAQPDLWTKEIFEKIYAGLLNGGVLVTYCSKSDVRRAMHGAGFAIEKIQGPHGKREMVRAIKKRSS